MDNEIEQLLKEPSLDARITCECRWLYWDKYEWVVRTQMPYKKHPAILYRGVDLSAAVDQLRGEA